MQPVVVAVDFSNTSIHALEYSIPLACRLKSDIIMVWVDKISSGEGLYPDDSSEKRIEARNRFEELINLYNKELNGEIKLEYKLRKGKIYHELDMVARTLGAVILVAGAHGASGFEEFWIGSNAFRIVTYSSVPVLTVRNDFPTGNQIGKILIPIDSSSETLQKLPFVRNMAQIFGSEVHVVATHSSQLRSIQRIAGNLADQAAKYLEHSGVRTARNMIVSGDIPKHTINYAVETGADIIAIMTEQETPANILLGPHAQVMINQSPVPVLSIHPVEHFCLQ